MIKILTALVAVVLLSSCGKAPQGQPTDVMISKILNGEEVLDNNPFSKHTAGVGTSKVMCTSVIIEEDLILTAAHCLYQQDKKTIYVVFGKSFKSGVRMSVQDVYVHEKYTPYSSSNDIALIRLKNKIPTGYMAIDLEESRMLNLEKGSEVTTLGYGMSEFKNPESTGVLRLATLTVNNYSNEKLAITLDQKNGKSVCFGDSGGPSFVVKNGHVVLVGISRNVQNYMSMFNGKNDCENVAKLTNPNYFYNWITTSKLKI